MIRSFIVVYAFGFALNFMMMALSLCIGLRSATLAPRSVVLAVVALSFGAALVN